MILLHAWVVLWPWWTGDKTSSKHPLLLLDNFFVPTFKIRSLFFRVVPGARLVSAALVFSANLFAELATETDNPIRVYFFSVFTPCSTMMTMGEKKANIASEGGARRLPPAFVDCFLDNHSSPSCFVSWPSLLFPPFDYSVHLTMIAPSCSPDDDVGLRLVLKCKYFPFLLFCFLVRPACRLHLPISTCFFSASYNILDIITVFLSSLRYPFHARE